MTDAELLNLVCACEGTTGEEFAALTSMRGRPLSNRQRTQVEGVARRVVPTDPNDIPAQVRRR